MSLHLTWANELRRTGEKIGREGMSKRAIAAVEEFDGTYKGAMILAGRMKAIAQMAKSDAYWDEQVAKGYHAELRRPAPQQERKEP